MGVWPDSDPDMVNRDPNMLNQHLGTVAFEEVIGEPQGVHSIDCVWRLSYKCFELWKNVCYIIMTTLCGICIAMCWGCEFAGIAFEHVWNITPCFKVLELQCGICKQFYSLIIHCCCDPLCEAWSHCFDAFKK